jgi:hypothetical protein
MEVVCLWHKKYRIPCKHSTDLQNVNVQDSNAGVFNTIWRSTIWTKSLKCFLCVVLGNIDFFQPKDE